MTWHETYREAYQHRFIGCVIRRCDGGWLVLEASENAILFGGQKSKTVQFFDADGGEPVSVNVGNGERTAGLVSDLRALTFGDRVRAVFVLRTQGAKLDNGSVKQYLKLSLAGFTVC